MRGVSPAGNTGAAKSPLRPSRGHRQGGRVAIRLGFLTALAVAALLPIAGPAAAAEGPKWNLTVSPNADYFLPGTVFGSEHPGAYIIEAENVGDAPTSGEVRIKDTLPPGLNPIALHFFDTEIGVRLFSQSGTDDLHGTLCPVHLECRFPGALEGEPHKIHGLQPGQRLIMAVLAEVPAGVEGSLVDLAKVSGGGAPTVAAEGESTATPDPPFNLFHFTPSLTDSSRTTPYTQAGGHPFEFTTDIHYETYSAPAPAERGGSESEVGYQRSWDRAAASTVRDPQATAVELPPGLIANPQGVPHCSLADYFNSSCSHSEDVVGTAAVAFHSNASISTMEPVYNLQPTGAYPGELGFTVLNLPFGLITAGVRTGSDYGVTATAIAPEADVNYVHLDLWGVPAEAAHNGIRGAACQFYGAEFKSLEEVETECEGQNLNPGPAGYPPRPFLIMPTQCSGESLTIAGRYNSWQVPGEFAETSSEIPPVDGCNQLHFEPTIEAHPTTDLADSPSGLQFDLHVPQREGCTEPPSVSCEYATPSLREAVVRLPQGLTVNPSAGNGLQGCSPGQIGLATPVGQTPAHFSEVPAQCPDASKIGVAEVKTPLLHEPLGSIEVLPGRIGNVYLATPHQNPFNSLLAAYIVLEGEGLIIKLPGKIEADPQTGQLTGKFLENPQTPFEDFHLSFFGGARGDLRTPATCGSYTTTATLTPYSSPESGPPAEPSAEFETSAGPTGGACANSTAEEPNKPVFHAGTETPQAGIYSPFSLKLVRQDGEQEIKGIDTTLPPGLVGKLAGVAECSDAQLAAAAAHSGTEERAAPSCPLGSEVGTVDIGAGAGPTPLYVQGRAYLAGPYKGAPLSLAIITPAVAGPFDLGTVVVRTALYTDPFTAQIHAVSDEIPHILEGIPLDVRSITLKMARPNFTLNPTNCEELGFTGAATSVFGQSAPLAQRFQVGGCKALKFKPKLSISLKGGTRRHTFPALKAVVTYPKQGAYANIASAQVTLPASANLEQAHINKTCLRPQLASHTCPASSIYGHASAVSPLLDKPLEGPVYLATGFGYQLPALVADLNGQIEVLLAGKVDTGREDGIRNTFEVVPDAPVSKFTLSMFGGKKGLIVNKENICGPRATTKALAKFTAQNGKAIELEPTVHSSCKKKGRKHGKGQHPSHRVGTSHR
jgi:hypothetical protein